MNSDLAFARAAFWLTYVSWVLIQIWIGRGDHQPRSGDVRDRGSRLAIIAGISTGALAAFYFAKAFGGPGIGATRFMAYFGLALAWVGLALHLWSIQTLGKFFRTIVILQTQHKLVTSGPYRFFRHPSYFSAVVTLIGLGLILNNWVSLALIVLIPLLGFLWRIRVEEQALYERFGAEFLEYRQKRWALLPPIW
jgi:protein-S-isoprenylcysteine O-methyltransferase Ste14